MLQHNITAMTTTSWSDLQHLVRAGLDARRHVAGVKGQLLHLCKVVSWIPVEHQFAHWDQREVFMGPNLKDKSTTRQIRALGDGDQRCPLLEDTVVTLISTKIAFH